MATRWNREPSSPASTPAAAPRWTAVSVCPGIEHVGEEHGQALSADSATWPRSAVCPRHSSPRCRTSAARSPVRSVPPLRPARQPTGHRCCWHAASNWGTAAALGLKVARRAKTGPPVLAAMAIPRFDARAVPNNSPRWAMRTIARTVCGSADGGRGFCRTLAAAFLARRCRAASRPLCASEPFARLLERTPRSAEVERTAGWQDGRVTGTLSLHSRRGGSKARVLGAKVMGRQRRRRPASVVAGGEAGSKLTGAGARHRSVGRGSDCWNSCVTFIDRRAALVLRARLYTPIRDFFAARGAGSGDADPPRRPATPSPTSRVSRTQFRGPVGLRPASAGCTSPEFASSACWPRASATATSWGVCFRNGEAVRHNPEFTMLEWVRGG